MTVVLIAFGWWGKLTGVAAMLRLHINKAFQVCVSYRSHPHRL